MDYNGPLLIIMIWKLVRLIKNNALMNTGAFWTISASVIWSIRSDFSQHVQWE